MEMRDRLIQPAMPVFSRVFSSGLLPEMSKGLFKFRRKIIQLGSQPFQITLHCLGEEILLGLGLSKLCQVYIPSLEPMDKAPGQRGSSERHYFPRAESQASWWEAFPQRGICFHPPFASPISLISGEVLQYSFQPFLFFRIFGWV